MRGNAVSSRLKALRIEQVKASPKLLRIPAPLRGLLPLLSLFCTGLHAEVSLPAIFGDHMVLQQGATIPVWGFAAPGERVSVSYARRVGEAMANASGRWRVMLRPLEYSKSPESMIVNGANRIEFRDVIVGDVWLCAGDANMAMPLSEASGGADASSRGDFGLRCFTPPSHGPTRPDRKGSGGWVVCTPESAPLFPAVPFFFARDLRASRQVPVGIINCSVTGPAPIISWMSPESRKGKAAKPLSQVPGSTGSALFNRMISPLIPYAMTGVIWYQGESEEGEAAFRHRILLPRLIRDWRASWKQGPFPFFMVSPAGFGGTDESAVEPLLGRDGKTRRGLPWLRESLLSSLTLPATAIAVTTDLGIPDDRYPPDKLDVGRRLARLARHRVYGEKIPDTGPTLQRMKIEANKVRLGFESHGGGLTVGLSPASTEGARDAATRLVSSLKGFALSGANRKWFPATARIEGEDVILSCDAVPHPEAVRYNWKGYPVGNLYNKEGLPAAPFRTDTDQPK